MGIAEDTTKPEQVHNGEKRFPLLKPKVLAITLGIVAVLAVFGVRYWLFSLHRVSTDNAYLTDDVVQIAPQVNGTVKEVLVKENQEVKQGDLLVVLDDANYRAAVAQRKADLDAAIAQAKGAGVNVSLAAESGNAQLLQAEGVVEQAESGIGSAGAEVARAKAGVHSARANARSAEANIGTAQSAVSAATANRQRAAESVKSAEALVEAAKAALKASQAVADKASRDAERYTMLADDGAVSKQTLDAATSAALSAQAQVESSRATVLQREADLSAAKEQVKAADAAIGQARAQLAASREQASAAKEGINQAEAQLSSSGQSVRQAEARRHQAAGQLAQARTAPRQVAVSMTAKEQALAKIEQARAALESAELQLSYTRIYAPAAGRISKKTVQVGALVQTGTPLMALVTDAPPWVVANLKETQLRGVEEGRRAEIRVDALPGKVFEGHVDSISAATGATFALLPADNATGNFTKVVQRIPVKIMLDPGQESADRLRAGMSVMATIVTK